MFVLCSRALCLLLLLPHYVKNALQQRDKFFVGAAGDGAVPTVACSGAQRLAVPTNGTAGAAGDTSRPYKWVTHQPPLVLLFVGAAGD